VFERERLPNLEEKSKLIKIKGKINGITRNFRRR
jgi:hypothetical protein